MKANDVAKAQKLLNEARQDQAIIETLNSGEVMTLTIGKTEIQLTEAVQKELRARVIRDLQSRLDNMAKQLTDMGVEL